VGLLGVHVYQHPVGGGSLAAALTQAVSEQKPEAASKVVKALLKV
jgi:hypothetical protein